MSKVKHWIREQTWAVSQAWAAQHLIVSEHAEVPSQVAVRPQTQVAGGVAVLPIHGMITQRAGWWQYIFGGTSTEVFSSAFSRAMASDSVSAVVLDIDSPGGTTAGVEQTADLVYSARGRKPVVAVANSLAASAAYWIGSQADRMMGVPGSDVGSIGVFRLHQDHSKALEQAGVKMSFISKPKGKVDGNPFEPLSDDARKHQQAQVDETYDAFVAAVRRSRGDIDLGAGHDFSAKQALAMGLIDGIQSAGAVVGEMSTGLRSKVERAVRAELQAIYNESHNSTPTGVKRRRLELQDL